MLRLDVAYRQQRTSMSCWWASLRMLVHYHTGRELEYPWQLEPRFRPPPGHMGSLHWNAPAGGEVFLQREEPWQWYFRGIEPDSLHVNQLAGIAHLQPVEFTAGRSTFGGGNAWGVRLDGAWMEERLRRVGPVYVLRRRGVGHHAYLIVGVLQRTGGPGGRGLVETHDPWPGGQARAMPMNEFQAQLAPQLGAYNLMRFRDQRAEPRVLEQDDDY